VDDRYPCDDTMRDHYLELLWSSQKVADRRLTELILQRLKDTAVEMTIAPVPACKIIPFPSIVAQPESTPHQGYEDIQLLWPRKPLRHLLSMACGYWAVVLFFGVFGLP